MSFFDKVRKVKSKVSDIMFEEEREVSRQIEVPEKRIIERRKSIRQEEIKPKLEPTIEKKEIPKEKEIKEEIDHFVPTKKEMPLNLEEASRELIKPRRRKKEIIMPKIEINEEQKKVDSPLKAEYQNPSERKFVPSQIISPVHGVLNKNYKINSKNADNKETEKTEVDIVLEKARKQPEVKKEDTKEEKIINLKDDKPIVKEVTIGEAEEYYNDLGLEYNVDYKDKTTSKKKDIKKTAEIALEEIKKGEVEATDEKKLFDLIDSMYEEEII